MFSRSRPRGGRRPRILVIGELPMFPWGNQIISRTFQAYLDHGFEIVYVTVARPEEISFRHPAFRFVSLHGAYRLLGSGPRLRGVLGRLRRGAAAEVRYPLKSSDIQPLTSRVAQIVALAWFAAVVALPALFFALRRRTVLIYGYEVFGGPIARALELLTRK